jgi:peptidylprolyl isomerase
MRRAVVCVLVALGWSIPHKGYAAPVTTPGLAVLLQKSPADDWRQPDPESTLYLELPGGTAIIELAPQFAPKHIAVLKTLIHGGYFDGAVIYRVEDNYVAQWGRQQNAERTTETPPAAIDSEFVRPARSLTYVRVRETDPYASHIGFSNGLPVALDGHRAWLVHCYGMVGVARGDDSRSGNDSQLFLVIGHAARQLDRNDTLLGRVLSGMELFSSLPRGNGDRGSYGPAQTPAPILRMQIAADLPEGQRKRTEVLREGSPTFASVVEWLRNRRDTWNVEPARHLDLCNIPIAVREVK